jgi:hypothetical protein
MKVKVLKYCQEKIDGCLLVLDVNKIIDVQDEDAQRLIENGMAQEIDSQSNINCENKMINILYKKRGRPRKEV